ncbi:MAG: molybdenum cofactor biosynthesis protein MoaE [Erythrobacter sp.]|uniref:molybdenum cofactor biosynthesis protein MoaE n=1 Tax=Erythrobacter sp. TaxID=1042 RepID=UPI0032EAB6BA
MPARFIDVQLGAGDLDTSGFVRRIAREAGPMGGLASFIGCVRGDDGVEALELIHYEPLTLPGMQDLAREAERRFDLLSLGMIHGIGVMLPGQEIVCVAAAARHRRDAIAAVDFCMDHLKSAAWFWKRERRVGTNGQSEWRWIEPRDQDHADLARWQSGAGQEIGGALKNSPV